ncbi:MAG: GTP-binding protein, partial [Proteobacteria bacterium]|nr:GTP-binding protein [Pseudomonadota bacterium]
MLSGLALPEAAAQGSSDSVPAHHDHGHGDYGHSGHGHDDPAHGSQFDTWSCRPTRVFEEADLRAWLAAPPAGLLRLKGVLRTASAGGEPGWSELQFAGRHGTLRKAAAPASGAALVAISLHGQLPTAALSATFGTSN